MSYDTNDPKGWCGDPSRGAALGRPTLLGTPEGPITVCESPLDRQGYDRNGTYFGVGQALFWYADDDCFVDAVLRAADLDEAVKLVSEKFPGAEVKRASPLKLPCWGYGEERCEDGADSDPEYGDQCEMCYALEGSEEH